jgi:hypothetical protein
MKKSVVHLLFVFLIYCMQATLFAFNNAPPPVTSPTLISPANYAYNITLNPQLVWNAVPGALSYRLQVSTDVGFGTIIFEDGNVLDTSATLSLSNYNQEYFWRVRAYDGVDSSDFSSEYSFTTKLSNPVLALPANHATGVSINPLLIWCSIPESFSVPGVVEYKYQLSTTNTFSDTISERVSDDTSAAISLILENNTTYYWRVQAEYGINRSDYTNGEFTTVHSVVPYLSHILGGQPHILSRRRCIGTSTLIRTALSTMFSIPPM